MSRRRRYRCVRTDGQVLPDGTLAPNAWASVPWSDFFVDIVLGLEAPVGRAVRAKLAWNDMGLFLFAHLSESNVTASVIEPGPEILKDNTFELLIDPDGDGLNYFECQVNALGTCWQLALPTPYSVGGKADLSARVDGLTHSVCVYGVLNDPAAEDQGWDVSLALPWSGLLSFHKDGECPPKVGAAWRINMARLQWVGKEKEYWVWSVQGEVNLHAPERWGDLVFVGAAG